MHNIQIIIEETRKKRLFVIDGPSFSNEADGLFGGIPHFFEKNQSVPTKVQDYFV